MTKPCENQIRRLAGSVVLIGIALSILVNTWFIVIPLFVGLNLLQSTFTGVCPAEMMLPSCGSEDS